MKNSFLIAAIAGVAVTGSCAHNADRAPAITGPTAVILGEPAGFGATGLGAGDRVRLHAFRPSMASAFRDGARIEMPVTLHAWAEFAADRKGAIDADRMAPLAGTYAGADANGLLWSGYASESGAAPPAGMAPLTADAGVMTLALERDGALIAEKTVALKPFGDHVIVEAVEVSAAGVSGSFAFRKGSASLPTLILLHGSEGADREASRAWAGRMAQQGYAAFALHYVAYGWDGGMEGVLPFFADVPLERIADARRYLAGRREADVERFGVVGVSKGAEFALSAAAREPFIDAVVACVPSDVVWAGFGREIAPGEEISSWTWRGAPLRAIQYDRYEDVFSGAATATEVHKRSRAKASAEVLAAAAIPVEAITAKVLLIGSARDETWSSAEMALAVEARMIKAGRGGAVEALIFPQAGHGVCGTGTAPARLAADAQPEIGARANAESYARTKTFLRDALSLKAARQ